MLLHKWTRIASGLSVYAATLGFLNLWGYWGRFGVNFLEFASLADLVRLSLMPLAYFALALMAGIAVGECIQHFLRRNFEQLAEQVERSKGIASYVRSGLLAMLIALPLLLGLGILLAERSAAGWILVGPVVAALVTSWLERGNVLPMLKPLPRRLALFVFCAMPFASFGQAGIRAENIENYRETSPRLLYQLVAGNAAGLSLQGHRYLGTLGDFAFFLTNDRTLLVSQWDEIRSMELRELDNDDQEAESNLNPVD